MSDGRKNNGGARQGAGRKPKAEEIKLIEKLSPLEDSAFEALKNGLINGDFPFVKLFMEYRFGKPKDSLDLTTDGGKAFQNPFIFFGKERDEEEG